MSRNPEEDPALWDINDVADFLKVEHRFVRNNLIKKEAIDYFLVGNKYRFKRSDVLEWLEEQQGYRGRAPTRRVKPSKAPVARQQEDDSGETGVWIAS